MNLLRAVKGGLIAIAIGAAAGTLGLPAWITVAATIAIAAWLVVDVLQVAFTEITIDTERVTARQGILSRHTTSVELFRVQDVEAVQPWWQRPFGVGTVVLHSSDDTFPRWRLFGLRNVDALRDALNRSAITLRNRMGIREINMGRV
ncbi:MAG: PH domain-containing protein [Burkholderiales bacterium]|nr:PH domain-containing protein [Burkholderiales bacterium]